METESLSFRAFKGFLTAHSNLSVFGNISLPPSETYPLEYNIIELALDDSGNTLSLISVDAFFAAKLLNANTLILASHSHTAPPLTHSKSGMAEGNEDYIQRFNEVLLGGKPPLQKGYLALKRFPLSGTVSRRSPRINPLGLKTKAVFAPAPEAPFLEDAELLEFYGNAGQLTAVVFIWACHPIAQMPFQSPDFIGLARDFLRNQYELPELPVLFWQGAAGDLRPYLDSYQKTDAEVFRIQGPVFVKPNEIELKQWWQLRAEELVSSRSLASPQLLKQVSISFKQAEIPLTDLLENYQGEIPVLEISCLNLGAKAFLFFSAEPLSNWQILINNLFPAYNITVVGYANECFGYLPTQKDVQLEGYEVYGFMKPFGISGNWLPDFQDKIITTLKDLLL